MIVYLRPFHCRYVACDTKPSFYVKPIAAKAIAKHEYRTGLVK